VCYDYYDYYDGYEDYDEYDYEGCYVNTMSRMLKIHEVVDD